MPKRELLVQMEVSSGAGSRRLIPAVAEDNAADVKEQRRRITHGRIPRWRLLPAAGSLRLQGDAIRRTSVGLVRAKRVDKSPRPPGRVYRAGYRRFGRSAGRSTGSRTRSSTQPRAYETAATIGPRRDA